MIIVRPPGRTCLGLPQEPGLAAVRVHMDGRERTAEGDEVLPFYQYISNFRSYDRFRRRFLGRIGRFDPIWLRKRGD